MTTATVTTEGKGSQQKESYSKRERAARCWTTDKRPQARGIGWSQRPEAAAHPGHLTPHAANS